MILIKTLNRLLQFINPSQKPLGQNWLAMVPQSKSEC